MKCNALNISTLSQNKFGFTSFAELRGGDAWELSRIFRFFYIPPPPRKKKTYKFGFTSFAELRDGDAWELSLIFRLFYIPPPPPKKKNLLKSSYPKKYLPKFCNPKKPFDHACHLTRFYTKMGKTCNRFQTKTVRKPYSLVGTHRYGLYKGVL